MLHRNRWKIYSLQTPASNILIRRWLPKGTKLADVTKEEVQRIEDWMNNYPRNILGGKCANTAIAEWAAAQGAEVPALRS